MDRAKRKNVCICVLGDIGHSPRMQYHALSLAEANFDVSIVGYLESKPHHKLTSNEHINICPIQYKFQNKDCK